MKKSPRKRPGEHKLGFGGGGEVRGESVGRLCDFQAPPVFTFFLPPLPSLSWSHSPSNQLQTKALAKMQMGLCPQPQL